MVSSRIIASLPDIESLRCRSQSLAMLEAILCPKTDLRYYAFNSKWGDGEMMASMDNGGGDDYFILFNQKGAIIKGFDHESEMSPYGNDDLLLWPGIIDDVPKEFEDFLTEPAFTTEDSTFFVWRGSIDRNWTVGNIKYPNDDNDADGSGWMLSMLCGTPSEYVEWARDYHDREICFEVVEGIYEHQLLSEETVKILNPDLSLADVLACVDEIGYPLTVI
jgi:hypothetical protein